MKFRPCDFWNLTPAEAELVVKGDKERQEQDFITNTYSMINAIGMSFNKNFKFIDPFKEQKNEEKPKKSREDLLKELEDIKKNFKT